MLEDDQNTLELTEEILTSEGYQVIAFNHCKSVDDIIDFSPKLILLDIRLTNGYGHILCSELKSNPSTSRLPVILISAANNLATIADNCHADNYLSKPYAINKLIEMVKQYD